MLVAMRLAKSGYYGGDPAKVLQARVDHVITTAEYEKFLSEYEEVFYELNRKK